MKHLDENTSCIRSPRKFIQKRSRRDDFLQIPSSSIKKSRSSLGGGTGRYVAAAAWVDLQQLDCNGDGSDDIPLVSASNGCRCHSICLKPGRPCTIGRSKQHAQFIFQDPHVSKQHCQILFDASLRRLYILDGAFCVSNGSAISCIVNEFRKRLVKMDEKDEDKEREITDSTCMVRFRASSNGVFVNGVRIGKGLVMELSAGDKIMLVCRNGDGACGSHSRIGFILRKIVFQEEVVGEGDCVLLEKPRLFGPLSTGVVNKRIFALRSSDSESFISECDDVTGRAKSLLTCCRRILCSDDPVSYIRRCVVPSYDVDVLQSCNWNSNGSLSMCNNLKSQVAVNGEQQVKDVVLSSRQPKLSCDSSYIDLSMEALRAATVWSTSTAVLSEKVTSRVAKDDHSSHEGYPGGNPCVLAPTPVDERNPPHLGAVELHKCNNELILPPGKNFYLNRIVNMQLDSFGQHKVVSLPELLYPVERITKMFIATFTSDILWYPPFPETIAFGTDRKKKGIACHHPKLLVLQRKDTIRVIVTSANLVARQWNNVTNTVWWQDFPLRGSPDYSCLFSQLHDVDRHEDLKSDFAAQLAGFMAALLMDVPSQAHWITELTNYDFRGAMGYLVASVPGIHSYRAGSVSDPAQFFPANQSKSSSSSGKLLGSVEASVVGVSHLFGTKADFKGSQLRKLAAFLGKCCEKPCQMSEIILRRNKNVPADANAVSVLVPNPIELFERDCVQLGFLPRNIAKWVSPLWDIGFFKFSGYVYPRETLAAALGGNNMKVQLILHISQGPNFQDMPKMVQPEHVIALCSLIGSLRRSTGLWRLEEVLSRYKWPESLESDFIYGSSSIGSSVNPYFLATFSSAVGKISLQSFDSEESDPEWGRWNAGHELKSPSLRIIFPTIERVKNAHSGILASKYLLCFSEQTWNRLKTVDILHDAVPHPSDRVGYPMHVKLIMCNG
ncbi:hypothetical protein Ancab_014154 [Ancistrocladus abbreviatus]